MKVVEVKINSYLNEPVYRANPYHIIFRLIFDRFFIGLSLVLVIIIHSFISKILAIYFKRDMAFISLINEC